MTRSRPVTLAGVVVTFLAAAAPTAAQEGEVSQETEPREDATTAAEKTIPPPPSASHKAGYGQRATFGGPNSPDGQLEEDDRVTTPAFRFGLFDRVMEPWFDWKRGLNERAGFQLSGHYVTLYQGLSDSLTDEDYAASGLVRLTTKWTLLGKGTNEWGAIVVMFDHRHNFTKIPPTALGSQAGYIGQTALLASDADLVLPNINWQQGFNDGRTGYIVGRFDPNDYINVLGVSNPWTAFQNLAILMDASIALPDTSYGIGGGSYVSKSWYVLGTLNDANGTIGDYGFFDGGTEFFSSAEVGWSPTKADRYEKNVNLTFWHVDERVDAGIDSAHGVALAANWTFDDRLTPFFRAGWSEGSAPIYNRSVTAGFIYALTRRSDLTGIAVNWGDTADDTLKDQVTVEGFYRLQLSQNLALTGGGQFLIDPALNPETDRIWVLSLRARVTF